MAKFKPDIVFNGSGDLHLFLFVFGQTLESFDIQIPRQQLLACGRCLRGEALSWWTLLSSQFANLQEAIDGIKLQYQDLVKLGEYVRKLNRLKQTGTIHEFFLEVDRLNVFTKLPEEALWKTLPLGLKQTLKVTLASKWPQPEIYSDWKKSAIAIGASLDAIEAPDNLRRLAAYNRKLTKGCWKCGDENHIGREYPNQDKAEKISSNQSVNIQSTIGEKRRRQGDPHYPPVKKALIGELQVIVLDSDNEDDEVENAEILAENDDEAGNV